MRRLFAGLAALALLAAPVAHAGGVWCELGIGYGAYEMGDFNDFIGEVNAEAGGEYLNEVNDGACWTVIVGTAVAAGLDVWAAFERFEGKSDYGDLEGQVALKVPAHFFKAGLTWSLHPERRVRPHLAAAVGSLNSASTFEFSETGVGAEEIDVEGSDLAGEVALGLVVDFARRGWSWTFDAGYRFAKIAEIEGDGTPLWTADQTRMSLDYSGPLFRTGVRYTFGVR